MKLLLTGATGFIGSEVLRQSIADPYVHHIYVLGRRAPTDPALAQHAKVTVLLHADFDAYPPALLARLREAGVSACIWALGGKVEQFASVDEARRVGITFPIVAAEALAAHVATPRAPFRFVFVSGWGAEHDQFRRLWIFAESRRIKGAAEKGLFEVADGAERTGAAAAAAGGPPCFDVVALRPGGVIAAGDSIATLVSEATMPCIAVDRLAKCAVKVARNGSGGRRTMENKECLGEDWAMVNSLSL